MGIFNRFPYTDFHRLNADWILEKVKEMLGLTQQAAEDAEQAAESVQGYETRLAAAEDGISDLETDMTAAQGDITTLQGRLSLDETEIAAKANANSPRLYAPVKILESASSRRGYAFVRVGGSPDVMAVQPVSNDIIDTSTYTKVYVGTPTENSQAATKKYVDDSFDLSVRKVNGTAEALDLLAGGGTGNGVALRPDNNGVFHIKKLINSIVSSVFAPLSIGSQLTMNDENGVVTMSVDDDQKRVVLTGSWTAVPRNAVPRINGVADPVDDLDVANKQYVDAMQIRRFAVVGTDVEISPEDGSLYKAGTVDSLSILSTPATGLVTVIFTSGSTATMFVYPDNVVFPDSFTETQTNTRYEISILDRYATVKSWGVE